MKVRFIIVLLYSLLSVYNSFADESFLIMWLHEKDKTTLKVYNSMHTVMEETPNPFTGKANEYVFEFPIVMEKIDWKLHEEKSGAFRYIDWASLILYKHFDEEWAKTERGSKRRYVNRFEQEFWLMRTMIKCGFSLNFKESLRLPENGASTSYYFSRCDCKFKPKPEPKKYKPVDFDSVKKTNQELRRLGVIKD